MVEGLAEGAQGGSPGPPSDFEKGTGLPGAAELASHVIGLPVRLAVPRGFGGLVDSASTPKHATGVGLVFYGQADGGAATPAPSGAPGGDHLKDIFQRMTRWVSRYF